MKNNYKAIKTFIALLSLIAIRVGAQPLNGVYTINNGAGASSTNFQTFSAMATALNTNGVSGPVTINVAPGSGPYNEQFSLNQISGAGASSKITINGNNCTIANNGTNSAQPYVILLNGADYISVNNLNVVGSGSYAYNLMFYNNADYNTFTSCTFSVPVNTTNSYYIPVVFSGSSSNYYTYGPTGNYNVINTCTMTGGYFAVSVYGNSNTTPIVGNQFLNNTILDFYEYGFFFEEYSRNTIVRGNDITQSQTRTSTSYGTSGVYTYYCDGMTIEANKVHGLFYGATSSTNPIYGIYVSYNLSSYGYSGPTGAYPNLVRNNMVYDIKGNGSLYGIYAVCMDGKVYNNTVVLDNSSSTSGSTYGLYCYSYGSNYPVEVTDNIVYITRAGSGTKYGMYAGGYASPNEVYNRNDYYVNGPSGTNYVGYGSTGTASSLSALQTQGFDATSFTVNPSFVNAAAFDFHPTNAAINNTAIPQGLTFDALNAVRNPTAPDIGALEFLTPNCSNSPSLTSVLAPTYAVCPGSTSDLNLSFLQSDGGITFQWQSSTVSPVGPWNSVPSATNPNFTTPPAGGAGSNVYYSALVTCANGNGSLQAISGQVLVAGTTTNNAPYLETFEGVAYNGMLPNCSWLFSGAAISTYTGTMSGYMFGSNSPRFMSFSGAAAGTNYAYTNGINLKAGVTYSASAQYLTEYSGLTNFTNLSLLLGTTQTTTGLTQIVSSGGAVVAGQYQTIGSTFTVANDGLYYLAIKEVNTAASDHLSIDNVAITIPCQLNSPTLAVAGLTTACLGSPVNLTASGANSYTWSTATNTSVSNFPSLSNTPNQAGPTPYTVIGMNSASGCTVALTKTINVIAGPVVSAYMTDPNNGVCPGETAVLYAVGSANSYTWSTTGLPGANTTIAPTANTTYTVMGSNSTNCVSSATIGVVIKSVPAVNGSASKSTICAGESVNLTAQGADTYSWVANSAVLIGSSVIAYPVAPTNYQLTGTDANTGCSATALISVNVTTCNGINTVNGNAAISVYPNPNNGEFTVALSDNTAKTIHVIDVTGRVLMSTTTSDASASFNISHLASGVYYVKIQSEGNTSVVKVVKQ